MINTDYDTVYCKNFNKKYSEVIDSIAYNTVMGYIKWEKRNIDSINLDYYYAEDKEFCEKYYLYKVNNTNEIVLQLVSDQDKLNYELDSNTFGYELESLLKDVKATMMEKVQTNSYYSNTYKSYKELKMEKASKQLIDIEPMRNFEFL